MASGVKTKIKLKFSKAARKRIRAALAKGGPMKIVVTATATDGYGKTSNPEQGQIQADRLVNRSRGLDATAEG